MLVWDEKNKFESCESNHAKKPGGRAGLRQFAVRCVASSFFARCARPSRMSF
jgi:hypothetical protein